MTVAEVLPPIQGDDTYVRVTFFQSQRFYKLPNDSNPNYIKYLKEAQKNKTPVVVRRADEKSDIIISVQPAKTK